MKLKHYASLLIPVCLVTFVFRAMELILSIDPRSGHFETGSALPTVFNVVLVILTLFFATVLLAKREPKPTAVRLRRAALTDLILGLAGALALISSSLFALTRTVTEKTFQLKNLFTAPALWQFVLAFGAAVFLIFFVTNPRDRVKKNLWRIMSLFLTGYALFMLIYNFTDLDVVFSRAFGIYRITFYGLLAAASINLSKILARLFGRKAFVFFTCMMAVLIALRLADALLWLLPGNPYAIPGEPFAVITDLLLTLLFLSQMKKLMKGRKRRKRPAQEAVEEETQAPAEAPEQISAEPAAEEPQI